MTLASRKALLKFGMWTDVAICGMSLLFASQVLYRPLWATDALLLKHPFPQIVLTLALGFAWHCTLAGAGAYDSFRINGFKLQAVALLRGTTIASIWSCLWLCLSRWRNTISPVSLLYEVMIFWLVSSSGLMLTRIGARIITGFFRKRGRNLRNVLIVGTNRRAISIAESLTTNIGLGYNLTGFIDEKWHDEDSPTRYKDMLLGSSENILGFLRDLALDEVIITLPIASSYQLTRQIIAMCSQQGILVRCEGSLFDSPKWKMKKDDLASLLITIHDDPHDAWHKVGKRILDVLVSASVLAAVSPLLILVALAIKLTSPGPVMFVQERLGLGKRRFKILKFRTMVTNAEALMKEVEHLNQTSGPTFKLTHDPRITKVGSFLRKSSLDELPQLMNVLIGDMSLVGPRPLPLRDYNGFSEDWHRRRFSVKPGITCLWQVSGRSTISFERWMELDMDYIDSWSLWLDFKILVKTVPAVLRGSGAV